MSDLQITQVDPKTGIVTVGMGTAPALLDGIKKLAQIVTMAYLANPGKSVIWPTEGSGLRGDIGQYNFASDAANQEISLLVVQRTKSVETEVLTRQEGTATNPVERLKSLQVVSIAVDDTTFETMAQITVTNELGDTINILV
jgi:hypothetical protein